MKALPSRVTAFTSWEEINDLIMFLETKYNYKLVADKKYYKEADIHLKNGCIVIEGLQIYTGGQHTSAIPFTEFKRTFMHPTLTFKTLY